MNHPNVWDDINGSSQASTEELVAAAIAEVICNARSQGQTLADLTSLVLEDDQDLDSMTRQWLSEVVADAWQELCDAAPELPAEPSHPLLDLKAA
ncbi:MAG TPA: hypothetical protein V6D19_18925 [Stenomitos sp.]